MRIEFSQVSYKNFKKAGDKLTVYHLPCSNSIHGLFDAYKVIVTDSAEKTFEAVTSAAVAAKEGTLSASQTGSNTFVATSGEALAESDKVSVKKGSTEITIKYALGEDKKTVSITTESKITDGDYTVTVTPSDAGKAAMTAPVKGETEKLAGIKFGNELALVDATNFYTVQTTISGANQWNEDFNLGTGTLQVYPSVAKIADGTAHSATPGDPGYNVAVGCTTGFDAKSKVYTLAKDGTIPFQLGDKVNFTAIYQNGTNVIQTTAELTVSNVPYVAELTFGEIASTNPKLKDAKINVKNFSGGSYYMPVTAKDQYGNALSAAKLNALIAGNSLFVSPSKADGAFGGFDGFDTLDNGTVIAKLGAKPAGILPGTTTLSVAGLGGLSTTTSFTVIDNPYIDVFTVSFPSTLIQSTPAEFEVSAVDQYGDAVDLYNMTITPSASNKTLTFGDRNTLTGNSSEIKVTNGTLAVTKNSTKKAAVFTYTPAAGSANDVATITSATPKVDTKTLTITSLGAPASIQSTLDTTKADSSLKIASGKDVDFGNAVVFIDSNGQKITGSPVAIPTYKAATGATDTTPTGIGTIATDSTAYQWTIKAKSTGYYSNDADGKITEITLSETYVVELYRVVDVNNTETIKLIDSKEFKVIVAGTDPTAANPYESYRAVVKSGDELLANWTGSGDTTTIEVYGTDANGVEVKLTAGALADYTLTADGGVGAINGDEISPAAGLVADSKDKAVSGEAEITVWSKTKNPVATVKVAYSNAPQVAQKWVVEKGELTADSDSGAVTTTTLGTGLASYKKTGDYESDVIDATLKKNTQFGYIGYSSSKADEANGGILTIAYVETAAAAAGSNKMTAYRVYAVDQYGKSVLGTNITVNGTKQANETAAVTKVGADDGTDTNAKNKTNGSYTDTFKLSVGGLTAKTITVKTVTSGAV